MIISKKKQFLIVFFSFLALAIPFKVMVLIEGFTEVRPENAIPSLAGLISGPVGAVACGTANLIADLFGTFNWTSVLGLIANMIAAYLPYRIWYIYSNEEPNLHKNINILKYVFICLCSAGSVAGILSCGLYYLGGIWIETIYTYVFFNNFGFGVFLGAPLFIILSSDEINIKCCQKPKHYILLSNEKIRKIVPIVYCLIILCSLIYISFLHLGPETGFIYHILTIMTLLGLLVLSI